jgi:orotate phosphoribosyltransferase
MNKGEKMEDKAYSVSLTKNPLISMKVIPGHFTTSHFHISHYLDVSELKTNAVIAKDVARELSIPYLANVSVDTIVCMEGTEVIGAYLAEELMQEGVGVINSGKEIRVLKPLISAGGKLLFQCNVQQYIRDKEIVLLVASISSGTTIGRALDCITYYGGVIAGISALFNAYPAGDEQEIHSMFTREDIPGYQVYSMGECTMCKEGQKLEAIINSEGYTNI